jgi:uridine kinase
MNQVIGIAGGTGSGKTTFTQRLLEKVDMRSIVHLQHDSYYLGLANMPKHLRKTGNFDHPASLDTAQLIADLIALKEGREIDCPVYDFATHTRKPQTLRIAPRPVVLVEGILIFADAKLRKLFDVKVFIDTPDDVRLARRLQRDIGTERERTAESVIEQYLSTVRAMHKEFVEGSKHHADIIIPGEADFRVAVGLLAAMIRAICGVKVS